LVVGEICPVFPVGEFDFPASLGFAQSDLSADLLRRFWALAQTENGFGTPLEPDNPRRSRYPLRKRLGLEIQFHDLRHSAVSLVLDLGVPPHIVRQIVGHTDIGVTLKVYSHASRTSSGRRSGSWVTLSPEVRWRSRWRDRHENDPAE
jgi:hypothetical protein